MTTLSTGRDVVMLMMVSRYSLDLLSGRHGKLGLTSWSSDSESLDLMMGDGKIIVALFAGNLPPGKLTCDST